MCCDAGRSPSTRSSAFSAIVALTVATTYGEPRYRAAVEIPLVLLAAVGIAAGISSKRWDRSPRDGSLAGRASDLASTTNSRNRSGDQDRRRIAQKVSVPIPALVALIISLIVAAEVMNAADVPAVVKNVLVLPLNGATIAGRTTLGASAPPGVTKVEFRATGSGLRNTVIATAKRNGKYLWLAYWDASTAPPGSYTIWAVDYSSAKRSNSPHIDINIDLLKFGQVEIAAKSQRPAVPEFRRVTRVAPGSVVPA